MTSKVKIITFIITISFLSGCMKSECNEVNVINIAKEETSYEIIQSEIPIEVKKLLRKDFTNNLNKYINPLNKKIF